MMVAVLIFSLIIVQVSDIFISGIRSQRTALASKRLLDQTSYAMEFMSRSLRMAKKQLDPPDPVCITDRANYELSAANTSIKFLNHLEGDDCQRFYLEDNKLKFEKNIVSLPLVRLDLTSGNIEITDLEFILAGGDQVNGLDGMDNDQPRVTVTMEARWKSPKPEERVKIRIQTTLSQRNLDIVY